MYWADTELLQTWHLFLSLLVDISLYQHTDVLLVYSYMLCMSKSLLAFMVPVVIPIFAGPAFLAWPYGSSYPWLLTLQPTPGQVLDLPLNRLREKETNDIDNNNKSRYHTVCQIKLMMTIMPKLKNAKFRKKLDEEIYTSSYSFSAIER